MSNYTITEGTNTLTLTPKPNTKYGKTIYNNTAYYNNTTDKMLQAKKNGTWNCFSLLTLDQVIIPKSTSFNTDNKINLIFKDTKGLTSTITIPLLFDDFEEELRKQFNPTFNNNMGYMYGFIKTVLFDIYTDEDVIDKINTYDPDTVTLTIATADTETLPNASVTVTAKDSDNTAIASLPLTILVGETSSTGTTDSNGQYNFTLTTEDCFLVVVTSGETEQYHTATKTIAISTKKPCQESSDKLDTLFNTLLQEEWIAGLEIGTEDTDETGYEGYAYGTGTTVTHLTCTYTMDGETIQSKGIPWNRTEPVQLTITDGNENTVTVDIPVQFFLYTLRGNSHTFNVDMYRTYQQYINPTDEEQQE